MFSSDSIVNASNRVYRNRSRFNKLMLLLSCLTLAFGLFWLSWIILTLLVKGAEAL
jgi:phosphate transport system permease protein